MKGAARAALLGAVAACALGCAAQAPPSFAVKMSDMGYMVKMDETYRVIPLETDADRAWFEAQLRALHDRRIDRASFVVEGNRRVPGHEPSWRRLAAIFGS